MRYIGFICHLEKKYNVVFKIFLKFHADFKAKFFHY